MSEHLEAVGFWYLSRLHPAAGREAEKREKYSNEQNARVREMGGKKNGGVCRMIN